MAQLMWLHSFFAFVGDIKAEKNCWMPFDCFLFLHFFLLPRAFMSIKQGSFLGTREENGTSLETPLNENSTNAEEYLHPHYSLHPEAVDKSLIVDVNGNSVDEDEDFDELEFQEPRPPIGRNGPLLRPYLLAARLTQRTSLLVPNDSVAGHNQATPYDDIELLPTTYRKNAYRFTGAMFLFALLFTGFAIYLEQELDQGTGSCCLPATCQGSVENFTALASLLYQKDGIPVRSNGACQLQSAEAYELGCPEAQFSLLDQCTLVDGFGNCKKDLDSLSTIVIFALGLSMGVLCLFMGAMVILPYEFCDCCTLPEKELRLGIISRFSYRRPFRRPQDKGCQAISLLLILVLTAFAGYQLSQVYGGPFRLEPPTSCQDPSERHCYQHDSSMPYFRNCTFPGMFLPTEGDAVVLTWNFNNTTSKVPLIGLVVISVLFLIVFGLYVSLFEKMT